MKDYFEAFRFKIAPLLNRRTGTTRLRQVSFLLGKNPIQESNLNNKQHESSRFRLHRS
jgi:hypothetical protein